jgi:Rps23 Pro-64 3,4-dihydroxylase Tpa1-like proline 4-hydroxylase
MLAFETRTWVASLLEIHVDELDNTLTDLFVTHYDVGNFLSPHNDAASGTYAFVASLASGPQWKSKFGGALEFLCEPGIRKKVCHRFGSNFNTLIIFPTRSLFGVKGGPFHRVTSVTSSSKRAGFYRFGFTGWYQLSADMMNVHDQSILEQMRGMSV